MDLAAFKASTAEAKPPAGLGYALDALWWDAKSEWDKAHRSAQKVEDDPAGQWVHAYLHRKQGDLDNAGYWYRQRRQARRQRPACRANGKRSRAPC